MFKNRIRTAAIAGIAALATGISGTVVATPAFAQDVTTQVATDVELEAARTEVNEYITGYALPTVGADFGRTDAEISAAVAAELAEAQVALAAAKENQAAAQEAAISARDLAAAFVAAQEATAAAVEAEAAVLEANVEGYAEADVTVVDPATLEAEDDQVTQLEAVNYYGQKLTLDAPAALALTVSNTTDAELQLEELEADLETVQDAIAAAPAQESNTDPAAGRAYDSYVAALEALEAQLKADITEVEAAQKAVADAQAAEKAAQVASAREAVAPAEAVLNDATDQRNILERIVAVLEASIAFYDLADKDALVEVDGKTVTLRQAYEDARDAVEGEIQEDKGLLENGVQDIDATSPALYSLQAVGLLEAQVVKEGELAQAIAERDQAQIDALLAIIAELKAGNEEEDDPAEEEPGNDEGSIREGGSSFDAPNLEGGSSDLGGFGIAAVIAAIIGVLALVVPNIQNFL